MFQRSLYKMKTSLFFLLLSTSSIPNQSTAVCYCLQVASNHRVSQLLLQYTIACLAQKWEQEDIIPHQSACLFITQAQQLLADVCQTTIQSHMYMHRINPSIPNITRLYHRKYQLLYMHHKKNNKRMNRYIARTHQLNI